MPLTRILFRLTPVKHQETGLAVTSIDLQTAEEWLRLMDEASEALDNSNEFVRIVQPGAPVHFFFWPGTHALPKEPQFIGFAEAASSDNTYDPGVQISGALPTPDLDDWKVYERETSFHFHEDEPILTWRIEPEYYPGMFHVGGVARRELLRIQRKLRCYEASADEQRQLFRSIEEDDPELADEMVAECDRLRRSLTSPQRLLRPEATDGRVQRLKTEDIVRLLKDADPEIRKATLRWLGEPDAAFRR